MMTTKNSREKKTQPFFQNFHSSLGSCADRRTDRCSTIAPASAPAGAVGWARLSAGGSPLLAPVPCLFGVGVLPPGAHASTRDASRCGNSHVARDQNGQNPETGPVGLHGRSPALLQPGLPLLRVFLKMHIYIYIKKF